MKMASISRRAFVSTAILGFSGLALVGCASGQTSSVVASQGSQSAMASTTSAATSSSAPVAGSSQAAASTPAAATSRVLVACFSATGNTQAVARIAARYLEADYYEIEAAEPYTAEDLEYHDETTRATAEQHDGSVRPELASIPDFASYDVILLGHPIWWGKAPRLICTLLESTDLSGKMVGQFCTSGSCGIEEAADELQSLAPSISWIGARRFAAGADDGEVAGWIDSLDIR